MSSEVVVYELTLKNELMVPLDARRVRPDEFIGKTLSEIKAIEVREGNTKVKLSELFDVTGPEKAPDDPNLIEIRLSGKGTNKIRYLGFKMAGGKIVVKGDIGPLAGYKMRDGSIVIEGNARGWLGAKMRNGTIEVFGNAADFVGGKLQGEEPGKGMRKGTIIIHGNAGSNVGAGMAGGTIIIEGNVKHLAGAKMCGGNIIIHGNCGRFAGARMTRGRVVVAGKIDGILPSFYVDSLIPKAKVKKILFEKPFMIFMGDAVVSGMGMLYVSYEDNKDLLSYYEELIREVKL